MGIVSIHLVAQAHRRGEWRDLKDPRLPEDTLFYAWLGCRRGFTFGVAPMSVPRGLPVDFEMIEPDFHRSTNPSVLRSWGKHQDIRPATWLGEFDSSWLLAREVLSATDQVVSYGAERLCLYSTCRVSLGTIRYLAERYGHETTRIVFGFSS